MKIKVFWLSSSRGGVGKEQCVIKSGDSLLFQSYDTIICVKLPTGEIYFSEYYNYSKTTSRYLNEFFRDFGLTMPPNKIIKTEEELAKIFVDSICQYNNPPKEGK